MTAEERGSDRGRVAALLGVGAALLAAFVALGLAVTAGGVRFDAALEAAARASRTPGVSRLMWAASVVGDPTPMTVLGLGVFVLVLLRGRRAWSVLFGVVLLTGPALSSATKDVFRRLRPAEAFALVHSPESFSYPSGHAVSSLLMFGLLAYVAWRLASGGRARWTAAGCAAGVLLIGASRVYLGVHWPTDVLGGWLLAGAVLLLALAVFEVWEGTPRAWADAPPAFGRRGRTAAAAVLGTAWLLAVLTTAATDPLLPAPAAPEQLAVAVEPGGLRGLTATDAAGLPTFTARAGGGPEQAITLVFVGSRAELETAFGRAGWQVADPPSLLAVTHEVLAVAFDAPYGTAPVTPASLGGRPMDLSFERPDGRPTARRRHHTRFWQTRFTLGGRPVWVATASFDISVGFGSRIPLPTHHIDPDIDAERELIARELGTRGGATLVQRLRLGPPARGRNAAGDAFFTDGQAAVLEPR